MELTDQPHSTTTMTDLPTLAQAHFDELTASVRGEVYRRGDHQYVTASLHLLIVVLILSVPRLDFKSTHAYSMETF
jgi:hypothetical protein